MVLEKMITKIIKEQVEYVTCLECCKYYIAPTTASCGHTLCHTCWYGRHTCPVCRTKINRRCLKPNLPLQNITEHVHQLVDTYKELLNINPDETFEGLENVVMSGVDPFVNINEWLVNSQNHFSAPFSSQETEVNMPNKIVVKDIQVHTEKVKSIASQQIDQRDWEKIEELPDTEDILNKNKENIAGPMDIEPFNVEIINDDNEYSVENPRRSSRKKEPDLLKEKKNTNSKIKSNKSNKDWTNVKSMKKEFNKVSKQGKNKLNVSIEMCKSLEKNKSATEVKKQEVNGIGELQKNNLINKLSERTNSHSEKENMTISFCNNSSKDVAENINNDHDKLHIASKNVNHKSFNENNNVLGVNNNSKDKNSVTNISNPKHSTSGNKITNVSFFKKSSFSNEIRIKKSKEDINTESLQNDDIEITIKVGNTSTNICIRKKDNDVQYKINSEREVQTSITQNVVNNKVSISTSPINKLHDNERISNCADKCVQVNLFENNVLNVSHSTQQKPLDDKKNTASADTSTVNTEIKNIVDKASASAKQPGDTQASSKFGKNHIENPVDGDYLNDLDIFDSESVKEGAIQRLERSAQTPSVVLVPTNVSRIKTQKTMKRDRADDSLPASKKSKLATTYHSQNKKTSLKTLNESESANYDEIMNEVFANIDADINEVKKNGTKHSQHRSQNIGSLKSNDNKHSKTVTEKYSENIFSLMDSEVENKTEKNITVVNRKVLNKHVTQSQNILNDVEMVEPSTPLNNDDDSDKSVVEETPQKETSHSNSKSKSNIVKLLTRKDSVKSNAGNNSPIEVSSSDVNTTAIAKKDKDVSETPITMDKFFTKICHNSTPLARKSLNFSNNEDLDQTCSFVAAKNTQEKEIMSKAFEQTQNETGVRKIEKYCLAGSCLSQPETASVIMLCRQMNWTFVQQYTKDLTHLVVGCGDDKRAQRSLKYMHAVAASKWIVSYEWVDKCLEKNEKVDEEAFEAVDITGEPGPRRSRLSRRKLFAGIKFYCMPPFDNLDIDLLKDMLQSGGGVIVDKAQEVKASDTPALLLAGPEDTQEDRFTYLALDLHVVPVNYEWALNCLGTYTLQSIISLLLCPTSLLPEVTAKWPAVLLEDVDSSQ